MNRKMLSSLSTVKTRRPNVGLGAALALSVALLPSMGLAETSVAVTAPSVKAISRSTALGKVPVGQNVSLLIGLNMPKMADLETFAGQVNDPKSTLYRHYLKPSEIGSRFGMSTTDANTVVTYLRKYFTSVRLMDSRTSILVDGTVGQANSAFGVTLTQYQTTRDVEPVGALTFYANPTAPKMPKSIASKVTVIGGLESFNRRRPLSSFVTPDQTRALYSVNSLYSTAGLKGEGVNVAITNLEFFRLSNLNLFYSTYGLPAPSGGVGSNVRVVEVAGGTGGTDPTDPNGSEGDLDIQLVLAMAPKCNFTIYDAPNTIANGITVLQQEQQDNTADIISESYGFPNYSDTFALVVQSHVIHTAMSAQGITYCISSGDDGVYPPVTENPTTADELNEGGNVIDPQNLIVGGTVATIDSTGLRLNETGWVGSGGGWTAYTNNGLSFNVRPSWQMNIGIPNDSIHNYRLYPDVALHAAGSNDPTSNAYYTAYSYVLNGALAGVSGTSASSPTFAGQLALILQNLKLNDAVDSFGGRPRLGHIQEALYGFQNAVVPAFTDITTGSNDDPNLLPDGSTSNATPGWDFVTGLGAPIVDGLYSNFLTFSSAVVADPASSASVYTITSPSLTLGTVTSGGVTSLSNIDGVSYVLQSVKQNGVGQVAAATVTVPLQSAKERRAASVNLALQIPTKATGYLYLLNASTGAYDLIQTITGTGTMGTTTVSLDTTTNVYISGTSGGKGGTVTAIVRSLQPTRLGSAPFKMTIDQLSVTERVPKG